MTDFNQWMNSLGIDVEKQYKNTEVQLIILEALYDLITDTRRKDD